MANTQTLPMPSVTPYPQTVRIVEKYFYLVMSLPIGGGLVYGFSHTTGPHLIHAKYRRPILVWVHALLFFGWVASYILQSALVPIRKIRLESDSRLGGRGTRSQHGCRRVSGRVGDGAL